MPETSNTAKLPEGQKVSKLTEITPEPEVLAQVAHVVTVKPSSGVVIVHNKAGNVVARYFDEEFAREEFAAAGLEFDKLRAEVVLKAEQVAALNAKRVFARPDRRLRSERRKGRAGAAKKGDKAGTEGTEGAEA